MATVNRNMFDATVTADQPGEASLMVLPLTLIARIISHVGAFLAYFLSLSVYLSLSLVVLLTDKYYLISCSSMTPETSPVYVGPVGSSTT